MKNNKTEIEVKYQDLTGYAEIYWLETNEYNVAHYAAFITVPWQDSRWHHLGICDKSQLRAAINIARNYTEYFLSRCMLCG